MLQFGALGNTQRLGHAAVNLQNRQNVISAHDRRFIMRDGVGMQVADEIQGTRFQRGRSLIHPSYATRSPT